MGKEDESLADLAVQAYEKYRKLFNEVYGEKIQQSRMRDNETPEAYRERLSELYPRPNQQAFLNGCIETAKAAVFGMCALVGYGHEEEISVPEVVQQMYPPGLNRQLSKEAIKAARRAFLVMAREPANELMQACYEAAGAAIKTSNMMLKKAQECHYDRNKSLVVRFRQRLQRALSRNWTDEQIWSWGSRMLAASAKRFRKIALGCPDRVNPLDLYPAVFLLSLAAGEMGMYLDPEDLLGVHKGVIFEASPDWRERILFPRPEFVIRLFFSAPDTSSRP